ncbi:hypothetical protein PQ478_19765 [Alkalihalophilus pseudofirmus]|uniref:hypothetical protein n=1 Tax=Alkalihalophilus pseudofirmus TaxID=79885 RepID=UPI00259B668C|nr:hypothetical protein [Alkalihalophilus pseudofirmus]WEG16717.1 hypothetical protein PQ478_19765 [Alkalihalophilus pseudofirmus]
MLKKGMPIFVAFLLVSGCGADINTASTSEDENEEVDEIDVAAYEYSAPQVPEDITAEFEMEHSIVVYFGSRDEENIFVDITKALRHHQQSLNPHTELDFVDMASSGVISKENLTLINRAGEHIKEDELLPGDELYLDYDLSQYHSLNEEIEIDVMVVNPVTAEDIVENYYASEEGRYRVSTLNDGAGGQVIDPSWDELDLILGHPKVQGYRNISQEQDAPSRRDLQSALGLKSLPQLVVFDHQGVVFHTDNIEELLHYLEEL